MLNAAVGTPRPAFAALVARLNVKTLKLEINMKTYIPTMALVATLTFACANSFAQKPSPVPDIPKTPVAPRALSLPAQAREEIEAAADPFPRSLLSLNLLFIAMLALQESVGKTA